MIRLLRKEFLLLGSHVPFVLTSGFFALLLGVVISFAFQRIGSSSGERLMILPGGIVVSILFIASGVFHQTTSHERESGALLGLYRSGVSGSKLYLAKCAANSLLLFLLTLCFSVVLGIMLEPSLLAHTLELLVVLLLTVIALTALGTLLAMISALAPTREILFPVLFFPLVLPIVGAAILLLREILFDGTIDFTSFPVKLLTSAALLYLLLGSLLFEETI